MTASVSQDFRVRNDAGEEIPEGKFTVTVDYEEGHISTALGSLRRNPDTVTQLLLQTAADLGDHEAQAIIYPGDPEPADIGEVTATPVQYSQNELEGMTIDALRKLAGARGVKNASRTRKAELIEAITVASAPETAA